jgi:DNA polymerase
MDYLFVDFETFYTDTYSLKAPGGGMTPPEYILDPRFETLMCSMKWNTRPAQALNPDQTVRLFRWAKHRQRESRPICMVSFNALFDASIAAWRYGFIADMNIDTMNLARTFYGHQLRSLSLDSVLRHMKAPFHKNKQVLASVKGLHRQDIIDHGLMPAFEQYSNEDNEGSAWIFTQLIKRLPPMERHAMSLVVRAAIQPSFEAGRDTLVKYVKRLGEEKRQLLVSCGLDNRDTLMSAPKFCAALEHRGVKIQLKPGKPKKDGTVNMIPALARTDAFMDSLLNHYDPAVQALAAARLGHKSTMQEARAQRFLKIADMNWSIVQATGNLPCPLRYNAAHTLRLGGEWKINVQNLPRPRENLPVPGDDLRRSLRAPPGCEVIKGDMAQIEARIVAWICNCTQLVEAFAQGRDVYAEAASRAFGFTVTKKEHPVHRFVGKTEILGLGYQCGAARFLRILETAARVLKLDLSTIPICGSDTLDPLATIIARAQETIQQPKSAWRHNVVLDLLPALGRDLVLQASPIIGREMALLGVLAASHTFAQAVVETYRSDNPQIRDSWRHLQDTAVETVWSQPRSTPMRWGPGGVVEIGYGYVGLPNGLRLLYHNIEKGEDGWSYTWGSAERHKMYGGAMLENIVQALSRIQVMETAVRLGRRGMPFATQEHDALAWVVAQEHADFALSLAREEMERRPKWGPDIPLSVEIGRGPSYGEIEVLKVKPVLSVSGAGNTLR